MHTRLIWSWIFTYANSFNVLLVWYIHYSRYIHYFWSRLLFVLSCLLFVVLVLVLVIIFVIFVVAWVDLLRSCFLLLAYFSLVMLYYCCCCCDYHWCYCFIIRWWFVRYNHLKLSELSASPFFPIFIPRWRKKVVQSGHSRDPATHSNMAYTTIGIVKIAPSSFSWLQVKALSKV